MEQKVQLGAAVAEAENIRPNQPGKKRVGLSRTTNGFAGFASMNHLGS